jgi:hypothetical protein
VVVVARGLCVCVCARARMCVCVCVRVGGGGGIPDEHLSDLASVFCALFKLAVDISDEDMSGSEASSMHVK